MTTKSTLALGALLFWALAASPLASASGKAGPYDCVIEPVLVTELGSPADGIIAEIMVDRGGTVKVGEVIARLRSEVEEATLLVAKTRAQSTLAVELARSRAELTKKEADRATELHRRNITATATLDKAVTEHQQAALALRQAEHEQQLAILEMKRAEAVLAVRTVRSPVAGIVLKRLMSPGEHVYQQTKIVRVAQIDPLHVEVYLPIALYPHIKLGMAAEVLPIEPIGGVHAATVSVVDKVFDSASDTFGVRLILPNPGARMPAGINCKVRFPLLGN